MLYLASERLTNQLRTSGTPSSSGSLSAQLPTAEGLGSCFAPFETASLPNDCSMPVMYNVTDIFKTEPTVLAPNRMITAKCETDSQRYRLPLDIFAHNLCLALTRRKHYKGFGGVVPVWLLADDADAARWTEPTRFSSDVCSSEVSLAFLDIMRLRMASSSSDPGCACNSRKTLSLRKDTRYDAHEHVTLEAVITGFGTKRHIPLCQKLPHQTPRCHRC